MSPTRRAIVREITELVARLLEANLAIEANGTVEISLPSHRHLIAWTGVDISLAQTPGSDIDTVGEYLRLLKARQFTCVLFDGSLLQLSYHFVRTSLTGHRLVYIPCPVALDFRDPAAPGSDLSQSVINALSEENPASQPGQYQAVAPRLRLRSTLRFDFDPDAQRADHPSSHLHFAGEQSRWAAFGPLCVGHFVRFLFRHAYPEVFADHEFLRSWKIASAGGSTRSVTRLEEKELFIDCK